METHLQSNPKTIKVKSKFLIHINIYGNIFFLKRMNKIQSKVKIERRKQWVIQPTFQEREREIHHFVFVLELVKSS